MCLTNVTMLSFVRCSCKVLNPPNKEQEDAAQLPRTQYGIGRATGNEAFVNP